MYALRWSNEIVCEKCCIIAGSFVSKVLIDSPHSTAELILITVVFVLTELLADALLVYSMNRWFGVPFLRLPMESNPKSKGFWEEVQLTALCIGTGSFVFKSIYETVLLMFPKAADAALDAMLNGTLNATLSVALNATNGTLLLPP
jgi:hypothetical protein